MISINKVNRNQAQPNIIDQDHRGLSYFSLLLSTIKRGIGSAFFAE